MSPAAGVVLGMSGSQPTDVPTESPTKQGEETDRRTDANRQEPETNRDVTNEEGPR